MARTTDRTKIEKVKKALIDIIVNDGSSHASISKVALKSGVSSGYLYRHYESKDSLIEDIYTVKFHAINEILLREIEGCVTLHQVILAFYLKIVQLMQSDENEILFFLKMMTDYSMKISSDNREHMAQTVNILRTKFQSELNPIITAEQIFTHVVGTVLLFINMRKRSLFNNSKITEDEINTLTQMTLNALK